MSTDDQVAGGCPGGCPSARRAENARGCPSAPVAFPETRWTLVLEAAANSERAEGANSLRSLTESYRPAVWQWFRRAGLAGEDAEDLTHDFLLQMLNGRVLQRFNRRPTRFRVFLQVCLRNFLRDSFRRRQARKRGGDLCFLELDESLAGEVDPAISRLDEEVARRVHELAMARVATGWAARGASVRFEALRSFMFSTPEPGEYALVAAQLGIKPGVVKKAVFDLRKAYYQAIREQVARTVRPDELADELRHLVEVLTRMQ